MTEIAEHGSEFSWDGALMQSLQPYIVFHSPLYLFAWQCFPLPPWQKVTTFDSCRDFPPLRSSLCGCFFYFWKKTWCLSFIHHRISSGSKKHNNKRLDTKRKRKRHDGGGDDGEMVSNQYHESTGIWNGAQGQFRSSTSAANCVSHQRGKASQGCSTTALTKSIVLCVCVWVCVWLCVLSAHKPNIHWQRGPGEVSVWWENCANKEVVGASVNKGPEADAELNGWCLFPASWKNCFI